MKQLLKDQREFFKEGYSLDANYRIRQLKRLRRALDEFYPIIVDALKADLNKSETESYLTEISMVYKEIDYMIKAIPKWVKPKSVPTSLAHFYSKSSIHNQPYGTVLIISPWNYPFQLALIPLVGAIAAGNCVILKPSEQAPVTSRILSLLIKSLFEDRYVAVLEGDGHVSQDLLKAGVDYCFFTGSSQVGKEIMKTAALNLTPVTLELGGKSPTIVTDSTNLDHAASRIVWGKLINAGQTCIAPDYLLVDQQIMDEFVKRLKEKVTDFYGLSPLTNPDYPKIINQKHFDRLVGLIDNHEVESGGRYDPVNLAIEPTIVVEPDLNGKLMTDEIFGPILPIIAYKNLDDALNIIQERPAPLALYLFSQDKTIKRKVVNNLSFGGGAINDTLIHFTNHHLPFGGIGNSGIGKYHGKNSLETFSNKKGITEKTDLFDIPLRYPPYLKKTSQLLKRFF